MLADYQYHFSCKKNKYIYIYINRLCFRFGNTSLLVVVLVVVSKLQHLKANF